MAVILNKISNVAVIDGEKQIFKNNEPIAVITAKTDVVTTSLIDTSCGFMAEDGLGNKLFLEHKAVLSNNTVILKLITVSNIQYKIFEATKDFVTFNMPIRGNVPVDDLDLTTKIYVDTGITTLTTNLGTTNSNMAALSTSLDTTNSNVTTLSGSLTTTNSNVTTLSGSLTTTNSNVTSVTNRVTNIESQIPSFVGYIVGEYKFLAGNSTPTKFLLCDGAEVLRTTYAALFAIVGTSFGSTSGTTFKVPDLRGRVLAASSATYPIGTSAGNNTQALTIGQLPTHTHTPTITGSVAYNGSGATRYIKTGTRSDNAIYYLGLNGSVHPLGYHPGNSETFSAIDSQTTHTHSATITNAGNSEAVDMRQPTLYAGNWYIYTGV